jgi:predicted TIM-barrel fold metal-dependent hydrolase
MATNRIYNVHTHIFNFKCVPSGFLTNYLPRALVTVLTPLLRWHPTAWLLSRVLGVVPVQMVKKYKAFLAVGIRNTPQLIFEDMARAYTDENVGFVVLPMNFEYMGGGSAPANYATQLQLVADVKRAYPNKCFPFLGVDPRMGSAIQVLNFVKSYFEPSFKGFQGIKLYPALGFFPTDERLELMYAYAAEKGIPVLTHCTRGGAFYAGRTVPPELFRYRTFNPTPVTTARHNQPFYNQLTTLPPKDSCDAFLDPVNYYDIFHRFPNLKLCFAHFGGDEEILKFLKNPTVNQGDIATGYNAAASWYYIIKDLMAKFPNVYTDISYTLFDTDTSDGIVAAIKSDLQSAIGPRILFGTDFFLALQEKGEKSLYTDFRAALADGPLWEQLTYVNTKNFLSTSFYTMP